jgi:hypothetical protein
MIPPDKYSNGIMLTDIISKQPQFVNNTTMFLVWKTFVFTNNTKASPGKQSVEAQCVVQWVLVQILWVMHVVTGEEFSLFSTADLL